MAHGERFTQESLGYVVDSFPQLVETAQTSGELSKEMERLQISGMQVTNLNDTTSPGDKPARPQWANFWYPTVLLNMEIKKTLPAEGIEWLFSRVEAKQIRNGRMDIELLIQDEEGNIVALSNHVVLIVPTERNTKRSSKVKNDNESKL